MKWTLRSGKLSSLFILFIFSLGYGIELNCLHNATNLPRLRQDSGLFTCDQDGAWSYYTQTSVSVMDWVAWRTEQRRGTSKSSGEQAVSHKSGFKLFCLNLKRWQIQPWQYQRHAFHVTCNECSCDQDILLCNGFISTTFADRHGVILANFLIPFFCTPPEGRPHA